MIDLEKDTPIEYSKQSRDYQVFRYVYNALFNQIKMYVDLIRNIWTDNIDDKLLLLRSYTLNFIPYYQWANDDLRGATNNFRYLVRGKGTVDAIKSCLEILARVRGLSLKGIDVQVTKDGLVRLIVGEDIADTGNIEDLLRYILPAGCYYEIVKYSRVEGNMQTQIVVKDDFKANDEGDSPYYYNHVLPLPNDEGFPVPIHNMSYHTGMLIVNSEGDES